MESRASWTALLAILFVIAPSSYAETFNVTLVGTPIEHECAQLTPTAFAQGAIGTISSTGEGVYMLDGVSGLDRATLSIEANPEYGLKNVSVEEYSGASPIPPSPIKGMRLPEGDVSMGVFVIIDAPSEDVEWALLKVRYTLDDFPADIAEESIHLAKYDPAADEWTRLRDSPELAHSTGLDTEENYAWANVSRFGVFGLMGGGMTVESGLLEKIALKRSMVFPAVFVIALLAFVKALWR